MTFRVKVRMNRTQVLAGERTCEESTMHQITRGAPKIVSRFKSRCIMNKSEQEILSSVKTQSAAALVSAVFEFLGKNGFTKKAILMMAKEQVQLRPKANLKKFRHFIRAYEEMGMIMSTWYTNPLF